MDLAYPSSFGEPDGPFTPRSAQHIVVHAGGGTAPWPILEKLVHVLDASGDLIEDQLARSPRRPHFP
ncbi:hypothetical protein [Actinoplanes aureus]|uniref:Uncharacterized protein n=1 Tax=Actinoplanes aureus TaxID=2792083 RepID=A0A931G246_9ACTN|nr:hypothetical protein [Actinoplanes aureus]MBG0567750.1 hypothetical protein [Actinoplanes aureus]